MSTDKHTPDQPEEVRQEAEVRRLIRDAGHRPEPPAEDLAVIKAAARVAWEEMAHERQRRRFVQPRQLVALAATVLIAVLAGWWWTTRTAPSVGTTVATLETSIGTVWVGGEAVEPGADLLSSSTLVTEEARAALRLSSGQSVRLDHRTELQLLARDRVELVRGAIYIDSPPRLAEIADLKVETPLGTVTEIGTQYEIRLGDGADAMRVSVREGAVSVRRDGQSVAARLGERLTVRSDGSVSRSAVGPTGPEWNWVLESAPTLDIEGVDLEAFLEWVTRETGWSVGYADAELEAAAATILLGGTLEGLRPDEAVGVVLQGAGLDHRLENGTLTVSRP